MEFSLPGRTLNQMNTIQNIILVFVAGLLLAVSSTFAMESKMVPLVVALALVNMLFVECNSQLQKYVANIAPRGKIFRTVLP